MKQGCSVGEIVCAFWLVVRQVHADHWQDRTWDKFCLARAGHSIGKLKACSAQSGLVMTAAGHPCKLNSGPAKMTFS